MHVFSEPALARNQRSTNGTAQVAESLSMSRGIPSLPAIWMARERVSELLRAIGSRAVTVVTSCAGAGKTVALTAWALDNGEETAWLSLDSLDNDGDRLWLRILDLLKADRFEPARVDALPLVGAAHGHVSSPMTSVLAVLEGLGKPTLVLDDVHLIRSHAVLAQMTQFVHHLPRGARVVLSGRYNPGIPLERLRAKGELFEVEQDQLFFTAKEAERLVRVIVAKKLSAREVRAIVDRCGGWVTALQLAAAHVRDATGAAGAIRAVASDTDWFVGYLEQEVLGDVGVEGRNLVNCTSIIDGFDLAICRALTGDERAFSTLRNLLERHVVVQHDDRLGYHPLVREAIRKQFRDDDPRGFSEAHRRAARLFADRGELVEAVRHFEIAKDIDGAVAVVAEASIPHLVRGESAAIRELVPSLVIGDGRVGDDPVRLCALALVHLAADEQWKAERCLRRLSHAPIGRLRSVVEVLEALHASAVADPDAMLRHVEAAMRVGIASPVGTHDHNELDEVAGWVELFQRHAASFVDATAGRALILLARYGEAEAFLCRDGQYRSELIDDVVVAGLRARALSGLGQLRAAQSTANSALQAASEQGEEDSPLTVEAKFALAKVRLDRADVEGALDRVEAGIELVASTKSTVWLLLAEIERVLPLLSAGRVEDARELIERLQAADLEGLLPKAIRERIAELDVRVRLAGGEVSGAIRTLRQLRVQPVLLAARVDLAAGRPGRAFTRLFEFRFPPDAPLGDQIERLILLAKAAMHSGHIQRARDSVKLAFEAAKPESLIRPFIDDGHDIKWLLEPLRSGYSDPILDAILAESQPKALEPVSAPLLEGLTERELEVLARLPSHLTHREIAQELYVSVNTLKTHLKGLYRKLAVNSRSEAVASARAHGLV